jgi:hypothetical protein
MSGVSTAMSFARIKRIVEKRATPMASASLLIESLDFCQLYVLPDFESIRAHCEAVANRILKQAMFC